MRARGALLLCLVVFCSFQGRVLSFQLAAGGLRSPPSRASVVPGLRGVFGRPRWDQEINKKQAEKGGAMLGSVGGMASKGGGGSSNNMVKDKIELGILIFVWYATSVRIDPSSYCSDCAWDENLRGSSKIYPVGDRLSARTVQRVSGSTGRW